MHLKLFQKLSMAYYHSKIWPKLSARVKVPYPRTLNPIAITRTLEFTRGGQKSGLTGLALFFITKVEVLI